MAPSAVETVAGLTGLSTDISKLKLYPGGVEGIYKEPSPVSYEKDREEKGGDGFEGAKVSLQPRQRDT